MARTENDTWDLASSVGATATMVAAARAVASRSDDAVIDDPFAEPLVRAVGVDFFTRLASGERADVTDYLRQGGWSVEALPTNDLLTRYGLTRLDDNEGFADVVYVTATN